MRPILKKVLSMAMILSSMAIPCRAQGSRARPMHVAFYYGYPSLVNGAGGDIGLAANVFAQYSLVVLGDGVEFDNTVRSRRPEGVGFAENQRTRNIIDAVRRRDREVHFFGYVCLGDSQELPMAEIRRRIRLWKRLGVTGIFLDEAGYDWRVVNRTRQNAAIGYIHTLGLDVFINAYLPQSLLMSHSDVRRNPRSEPIALQSRDLILLESFPIYQGRYEATEEWRTRLRQALDVRTQYGVNIVSLATAREDEPIEDRQLEYACWNAWMFDFDGIAWGEPGLSADSSLPDRSCAVLENPPSKVSRVTANLLGKASLFSRETGNGSVVIDVEKKTVRLSSPSLGTIQQRLESEKGLVPGIDVLR